MCFFSFSTLPRRKVVTVVVLQSCGIQFYVLLRMAVTPDKKDKAYTKQRPTQDKSLHKAKAKIKTKPLPSRFFQARLRQGKFYRRDYSFAVVEVNFAVPPRNDGSNG